MRGRKPKPTALKLLDGTQACRINRDEPVIPAANLDPPKWLNQTAREHWAELAPMLAKAGLLTEGDRPALALLCDCYLWIRHDPENWKARELYRKLLVEFGLTPSSRSRLKTTAEPKKDALAEFLSRRKA